MYPAVGYSCLLCSASEFESTNSVSSLVWPLLSRSMLIKTPDHRHNPQGEDFSDKLDSIDFKLSKILAVAPHQKLPLGLTTVLPRAYILLRRRGHATSTTIEIFQCYYF